MVKERMKESHQSLFQWIPFNFSFPSSVPLSSSSISQNKAYSSFSLVSFFCYSSLLSVTLIYLHVSGWINSYVLRILDLEVIQEEEYPRWTNEWNIYYILYSFFQIPFSIESKCLGANDVHFIDCSTDINGLTKL